MKHQWLAIISALKGVGGNDKIKFDKVQVEVKVDEVKIQKELKSYRFL